MLMKRWQRLEISERLFAKLSDLQETVNYNSIAIQTGFNLS